MLLLGNSLEPRALLLSGKNRRHHCPPKTCTQFFQPKQLGPFPERLELPFPDGEILSGYEEDVSIIRDRFTAWVKADPNDTSERHMVDVGKAFAEFREASVRRQEAPAQEYFFRQQCTKPFTCSEMAYCLQLESGPRRGKERVLLRNELRENGTSLPCRR